MTKSIKLLLQNADLERSSNEHEPPRLQRMTARAVYAAFEDLEPDSPQDSELYSYAANADGMKIRIARTMLGGILHEIASNKDALKKKNAAIVALIGLSSLWESHEDPGPFEPLRPSESTEDESYDSETPPWHQNPRLALVAATESGELGPVLSELCRNVAMGVIAPDSRTLLSQMSKALDGTLEDPDGELGKQTSKKSSPTRKKKGGRPSDTDHDADRRIYEAWKTGQYKTYKELAREKGVKRRTIVLALQRHKARLRRGLPTPRQTRSN